LRERVRAALDPVNGRSIAETGVLLHVFGDAYAHSREVAYVTGYRTETRNCGGETVEEQIPIWGHKEVCYPPLIGHGATILTRGCGGSEPDAIGRHPELYKLYVENLYQVLCALRPNAPREQNGFTIQTLIDLANGTLARTPITSPRSYNFAKEVTALRGLFSGLVDDQQRAILRPGEHRVDRKATTWDVLPGDPNAAIDAVMELDF
jgi:hypothetical protein